MYRIADGLDTKRPSRSLLKPDPGSPDRPTIRGRRVRIARATLALLALGMIWRVARFAMGQPLWGDEAFLAVNLLTRDFAGLLGPLDYRQIAPIGFLWAELAVVRALGPSEWALRLLPFLSGLASLALFYRFSIRAVDRRSALLAVGILAASFYPVRHANEAKPYATDLLLSLVITGLAWDVWSDRMSWRRWLTLTFAVGMGVWFSYPLLFVVSGVGLVLAARVLQGPGPRAKPVAGFVGFALAGAASWLAFYTLTARPQAESTPVYAQMETWRGAFPPLGRPWALPGWLLDVHTGNMLAYPQGGNDYGSTGTAILVVAGILALRKRRAGLLALLLAPLLPTLLASVPHRYPYGTSARTTLYMAPAFCLLAGVGAAALIRRLETVGRRRVYRVAWLALAVMIAVGTAANLALPYKNYEDKLNRDAVREFAALARPGDRWLAFDGLDRLPDTPGTFLEHWLQQMAEVRYNVLSKSPVPVAWNPSMASVADLGPGRTWLIVHRSRCPGFDEVGLSDRIAALTRLAGPPRVRSIRMTRGESLEAFEFDPAPRPAGFGVPAS